MNLPWRPVFALLLNALVFGVCWWPFRHLADAGLHTLWATAFVYLVLCALVLISRPTTLRELLSQPGLLALMVVAGLTNASFNLGVVIGDVVRVVLLFYLMPVWAALIGRWLLGEALTTAVVARIACAVLGAALVLYQPGTGMPVPHGLGDWLGLSGGLWFAFNNVLLRRHAATSEQARALAMFAGGLLIPGTLAVVLSLNGQVPLPSPPSQWIAVAALLTIAFAIANWLLLYGTARLPANVAATVMISEVLFAAVSAWLIAGESMDYLTLAGGGLIIGASVAAAVAARNSGNAKKRVSTG